MATQPVIEAEGLVKHYGEVQALAGLDVTVEKGYGPLPARPQRGWQDDGRQGPYDPDCPRRR